MSWFNTRKASSEALAIDRTQQDLLLLRDCMVYLVKWLGGQRVGSARKRASELARRLERFPVPTGLPRELERLVLGAHEDPVEESPSDKALALSSLAEALEAACIAHDEVERRARALRQAVPDHLEGADAESIARMSRALSAMAAPLKKQLVETQEEMVLLIEDVGAELEAANRSTDRIDKHVGALVRKLSKAPDVEAVRQLRGDLKSTLDAMATDTRQLRGELMASQERARRLDRTLGQKVNELELVREQVIRDPLTGVSNRAHFDLELPRVVNDCHDNGHCMALLILDIDHFKTVNDTFGHPAGDDVLRVVARRIRTHFRSEDLVARIGGEEFGIIVRGIPLSGAMHIANRVRKTVAGLRFKHQQTSFQITCSLGVASLRADEDGSSLYRRADEALYQAKKRGRDRVVGA